MERQYSRIPCPGRSGKRGVQRVAMPKSRVTEALEHMQSKRWLCGPSKVAIGHDSLAILGVPPNDSKRYRRVIRRAVREVIEGGKEGMLLLDRNRAYAGNYRAAAWRLSKIAEDVHRGVLDWEKCPIDGDDGLDRWLKNHWEAIRLNPNQRVEVSIPSFDPADDTMTDDKLLFTAVSSAYEPGHPRHFPMDAVAATKLSTINAIATRVQTTIYNAAGKRAGGKYATGDFFVFPGMPSYEPPEYED